MYFHVYSFKLQIHAHIYRSFIRHHKMLGVRIAKRKIEPQKPANPCDTRLCSCIFSVNTRQMNTTRVSNFFIEIRVVSYLESLAIQGFPFFCVWLMCIGKHQNCEDVFIRRHRYMNTAFRYSYFDMLLQTLAVSCISAFDGGEPHYKNGYTHPRSSENAVQKCIHVGRSPLF